MVGVRPLRAHIALGLGESRAASLAVEKSPVERRHEGEYRCTQIGGASIDVRLGTEFLLLRRTRKPGLDPAEDPPVDDEGFQRRVVPIGGKLWLHPEYFLLAATLEYIRVPDDLGAYVIAISSWGRVGLIVATVIVVHPSFAGYLTLELVNEGQSPIALYPGLRIAQLAFHSLDVPTAAPYGEEDEDKYLAPTRPGIEAFRLPG